MWNIILQNQYGRLVREELDQCDSFWLNYYENHWKEQTGEDWVVINVFKVED